MDMKFGGMGVNLPKRKESFKAKFRVREDRNKRQIDSYDEDSKSKRHFEQDTS